MPKDKTIHIDELASLIKMPKPLAKNAKPKFKIGAKVYPTSMLLCYDHWVNAETIGEVLEIERGATQFQYRVHWMPDDLKLWTHEGNLSTNADDRNFIGMKRKDAE